MPKIVNFHIPAEDPQRAQAFYKEVFGWTFEPHPQSETYYVNNGGEDGPGIPAAIARRSEPVLRAPVPTIEVESIDDTLAAIATKGGRQARVTDIPGIGRFAFAMDSEDNVIAVLQPEKPQA